jgi:nucleoside-diphosphate-sugar epimerase
VRIFVAGATGVIGSRLLPQLVKAGHDVTAVTRSDQKAEAATRVGARPVRVDLFDADSVARSVEGHDVIINLATHIPPASRAVLPGAWRATNAIRRYVPANLVRAAQRGGVKRIIQESFAPAYPDCGDRWIDENEPLATARYNRGIADAEAALAGFRETRGDGVTLRFGYFYGADSDFVRAMIDAVRKGRAPASAPDAFISSISHDDAASAVISSLDVPAGVYNVVDDEPVTRREFFESLADALKVPPPKFLPRWTTRLLGSLGETLSRSQRISNARFRKAAGWSPIYPSVRDAWSAVLA